METKLCRVANTMTIGEGGGPDEYGARFAYLFGDETCFGPVLINELSTIINMYFYRFCY